MTRNLTLPRFPSPPREYDQRYMADMIRAFALYQQQMQNPGEGRATFMVFTNLRSDDQGLEPGTVFMDGNGFLKVSMESKPNVGGLSASGGVGQITKAP
jgi:hypothetical protein